MPVVKKSDEVQFYHAFLEWVRQQKPGVAFMDLAINDRTYRQNPLFQQWISAGLPTWRENDIIKTIPPGTVRTPADLEAARQLEAQVNAIREGDVRRNLESIGAISQIPSLRSRLLRKPFQWAPIRPGAVISPTVPTTAPKPLQWYVPGQVLVDPNTGKFYDASGQAEISLDHATQLLNEYDRATWERRPPPSDWQAQAEAARLAESRRQFDILQAAEQAKLDWTKLQGVEAEKQRVYSLAQQRFMAKDVGQQRQNVALQRQVDELQFERDRERLLSGIPSNDWITRYTLQNQPNPYQRQEVSPINQLEANLDSLTGEIQKWEAEAVFAANAEAEGQPYHITSAVANEAVADLKGKRTALEGTWKTVQEESRDWSPQPVPQPFPSAPSWLPQFAPGLQAGQMITRQNVPTPSGQQLTAMSRDQLEQLGYFGKWTGQLGGKYPWETLTESAALMQPRSPGFGRTRWTPPRQV